MQRIVGIALAGSAVILAAAAGAVASGGERGGKGAPDLAATLDGTTWCSPDVHTRIAVDHLGVVTTKEGKNVCMEMAANAGAFVVQVTWWNVDAGIHVQEWAVALPTERGTLEYIEPQHPDDAGFPGIAGAGELRLTRQGTMLLHQFGLLADGSAAAFTTTLERVEAMPEIPLPVTYPAP
ncbi:MAG: hypothetical protein ACKOTZ_06450 [Chloroflexota bacterium]